MAYPQFSFSQFLQAYCLLVGATRNSTTGVYEPTVAQTADAAQWLTLACEFGWQDWNPSMLLPSITESGSVTPSISIVAWADLKYSSKWSLWTTDPRSSYEAEDGLWPSYARLGVQHASGVLVVDDPGTAVTAFYQKAAPVFSHEEWAASTAYDSGAVKWNTTTGHCYKALAAITASPAIEITDTAKWEVQSAPEEMRQALWRRVNEMRLELSAGQPATANQAGGTAASMMEDLYLRHLRTAPPWFIMNGGLQP
jgi:hypothetical protein